MKVVSAITILILFMAAVVPSFAHVLETNEPIGAVLHVVPNDDPIAGTNTDLVFELTDKAGAFDPAQCYCSVQVLQNDTVITSARISGYDLADGAKTLYSTVVFPEIGVYKVQLIGKPVTNDWFDEFTLEYEVRVVRQVAAAPSVEEGASLFTPLLIAGIGIICSVVAVVVGVRGQKKTVVGHISLEK